MVKKKLIQTDLKASERFSSLRTALLTAEGGRKLFQKKLEFNRLYAELCGLPKQFWPSVPDVGILGRYWSKLSEYCHRQLQPKITWDAMGGAWVTEGYDISRQVPRR